MLKRVISMAVTPWIVFVATTNSLFLANQADLNYNLGIYVPFVLAFLVATAAGVAILAASKRIPVFRPVVWGVHLLGLGFLVLISGTTNDSFVKREVMWLAILIAVIVFLIVRLRRADPMRAVPAFAILSVLLVATDTFRFVREYEFSVVDRVAPNAPMPDKAATTDNELPMSDLVSKEPNIYHIVLDGYQSDLFPLTLDAQTRNELSGFTWFPNTITTSGRTRISIPSVFSGKIWDTNETITEFTESAMNSTNSLLHALKSSGYATTAYLHKRFSFAPNLFDGVFYHHNASRQRRLFDAAFYKLWAYRFLPRLMSHRLLDAETRTEIVHGNLSPNEYPAVSYDTYLNFVQREADLQGHNRYTFVHLLLPHPPYVLDRDCEYRDMIEPIEQFCCATRVIVSLVQLLRELERFQDSLIVVHGDHGLNFTIGEGDALTTHEFNPGGLEWNAPRAKTLLLIKPAGVSADKPLVEADAEATTLDVTPTMYRLLGLAEPAGLEGVSLYPAPILTKPRKRAYHYFTRDYTEEVYRFVVKGNVFGFDRILRPDTFYTNIPTVPVAKVVEAEAGFITKSKHKISGEDRAGTSGQYTELGSIFFRFDVGERGTYQLKARVIANGDKRDELYVSIDEAQYRELLLTPSAEWKWHVSPFVWELTPGEHVLTIRQKGKALLDQIELVRIP